MINPTVGYFISQLFIIIVEYINKISGNYSLVYRENWNAQLAKNNLDRFSQFKLKYFRTQDCHTRKCTTIDDCCEVVHSIQKEHIENGWDDISCNFLIDGNSNIYEGVGWYRKVVSNITRQEHLSICFFGIENYEYPPEEFGKGLKDLLQFGKEIGYLSLNVRPLPSTTKLTIEESSNVIAAVIQNLVNNTQILSNQTKINVSLTANISRNSDDYDITNSNVDWSKVFPDHGKTAAIGWDQIFLNQNKIIQPEQNKILPNSERFNKVNWSRILQNYNSKDLLNWSKIIEN